MLLLQLKRNFSKGLKSDKYTEKDVPQILKFALSDNSANSKRETLSAVQAVLKRSENRSSINRSVLNSY